MAADIQNEIDDVKNEIDYVLTKDGEKRDTTGGEVTM